VASVFETGGGVSGSAPDWSAFAFARLSPALGPHGCLCSIVDNEGEESKKNTV
jgi:hypothetical protein